MVFGALMVFTALTVWVATIDLGFFNTVAALAIACVKALLVILFFMHLKFSPAQTKLAMAAGVFWLLILLNFTIGDYFSRHWQSTPAGWTEKVR